MHHCTSPEAAHTAGARYAAAEAARGGVSEAGRGTPRRRGFSCVLAMMYLVLFSVMALAFFAQTTVTAQIAANDRNRQRAIVAAESGEKFMRYRLNELEVKYCPPEQLMAEVHRQLVAEMKNSPNLGYGAQQIALVNDEIHIPADPAAVINLGEKDLGFRARIRRSGRQLILRVAGHSGGPSTRMIRGVEYTYQTEEIKADVFKYGVAGRGQVEVAGGGIIRGGSTAAHGTVMSTTTANPAVSIPANGQITGDVYVSNPAGTVSYGANAWVAGSQSPAHRTAHTFIGKPNPLPDFPEVDTAAYVGYAKNVVPPGAPVGSTFRNIIIPANRGTAASPYTFGSGATIEGVCYIEAPNVVWFAGGCTIRGVVVGANKVPATTSLATNVVEFRGQATSYDMSTLPDNDPDFPQAMQELTGATCILPGFHVKFSGGHAAISGTIVSDQLSFTGGANGNISGNVMGLSDQKLYIGGSGVLQIEQPGTDKWPAGLFFRHKWVPQPKTFRELEREEARQI